jgi:hypothetical protein
LGDCFIVSLVGVVWCGVVWCGVVWCGVVWCGVVWCDSAERQQFKVILGVIVTFELLLLLL